MARLQIHVGEIEPLGTALAASFRSFEPFVAALIPWICFLEIALECAGSRFPGLPLKASGRLCASHAAEAERAVVVIAKQADSELLQRTKCEQ